MSVSKHKHVSFITYTSKYIVCLYGKSSSGILDHNKVHVRVTGALPQVYENSYDIIICFISLLSIFILMWVAATCATKL